MTQAQISKFRPQIGWLLKLVLLAGVALIVMAHLRLAAADQWQQLTSERLIKLMPDNCEKLSLCTYYPHFPPYTSNVLIVLAVGGLLAVLGKSSAATIEDVGRSAHWTLHLSPSRWRVAYGVLALVGLIFSIRTVYLSLDTKTLPPIMDWLLNLILVGAAFYCRDRAAGNRSFLSRREAMLLMLYPVLLVGLGFVFKFLPTGNVPARVVIVYIGVYICWQLWYLKILSAPAALLAAITVAAMGIYTYRITSWQYGFVGDEYAFFNLAENVIEAPQRPHLLDALGVYEYDHPIFSTYIQAATMRLYGSDVYGWRVSETFMMLLAIPTLYGFMRTFAKERAALFAVIVYACCHVLLSFAKVGNSHPQSIPVFMLTLAVTALAIKRQSWLGIFLSGATCTLAFYTFPLAIPFMSVPLLLIGMTAFEAPKQWLRNGFNLLPVIGIFTLGLFLVFYPRLVDTGWLEDLALSTVYESEVKSDNRLQEQILPNFLYTLTLSLIDDSDSHYVYGVHLDPVSSCLMVIGMAWMISQAWRRRIALFLILTFMLGCFLVGGIVQYPYPPHTRTFMLALFYGMFGGLGADMLLSGLIPERRRWQSGLAVALLVVAGSAILYLNLYQLFVQSENHSPRTRETLVIREFQITSPETDLYYVTILPFYPDHTLMYVLGSYQFDLDRFHVVHVTDPREAVSQIQREAVPPYRIIIDWETPNLSDWLMTTERAWSPLQIEQLRDTAAQLFLYRLVVNKGDTFTPLEPQFEFEP